MRTSLGCDITNDEDDVRYTDDTDKRIRQNAEAIGLLCGIFTLSTQQSV
jgi:hypothetical protein